MSGSSPRRVAIVSRARVGGILDWLSDAAGRQRMRGGGPDAAAQFSVHVRAVDAYGHYGLYPGRTPREPAWLKALAPLLCPLGLHSVFVAEKPSGRAGGAS